MSDANKSGNVCVVTGGSSGIGLATARRFCQENHRIAICGRERETLQSASRVIRGDADSNEHCYFEVADFQMGGEAGIFVRNVAEQFGRIDVLVNCAGFAPLSSIQSFSDDDFEAAINVNCRSVYETTKAAWPSFVAQQSGVIINISSLAAVEPFPGFSVYGGCKAWVDTFTKAMADEGKPHGICAISIRPGAVATNMLHGLFPEFPAEQTLEPGEVADLIWKLAQPESATLSGQAITVKR